MESLKEVFSNLQPPTDALTHLDQAIKIAVTENYSRRFEHVVSARSKPVFFEAGVLQVEACAFYGQNLPVDSKIEVIRVANGTPLTLVGSGCAITRAIADFGWKKYNLQQAPEEIPRGPMILVVNVIGTKIPFKSSAKLEIADNITVTNAINEVLTIIGRSLKRYRASSAIQKVRAEKLHVITTHLSQR